MPLLNQALRALKHVPSPATLRNVADEEHVEALLRERSLLYIASSRSRDALFVTWSGKRTELLGSRKQGDYV